MTRRPGDTALVVGAGIVGLASALELHLRGFDVSVLTADQVADGASSANAGLVVPADSLVWPGPHRLRAVPGTLFAGEGSPIELDWSSWSVVPWGVRFLSACGPRRFERATRTVHSLSQRSAQVLAAWIAEFELDAGFESNGMVLLFDTPAARDEALLLRQPLSDAGERYAMLGPRELRALETGYRSVSADLWALFAPHAGHGDSTSLCNSIAAHLEGQGVSIDTGSPVLEVVLRGGRVHGVRTPTGIRTATHVVLAAGTGSETLARSAGLRVGVLPVKGEAVTVPIRRGRSDDVPRIGGVLEHLHVAYSRMGDRLRLSTGARIGSTSSDVSAESRARLRAAANIISPGALDWNSASYRAGHRPMTPTGIPAVGPTEVSGLWLNTGHGSLGWTQAAGSAELLGALMTDQSTALDATPFLPHPHRRRRPVQPPLH